MSPPILIVDDDRDAREALRFRLTHAGFDTVTAGDARAAIAQFEALKPRVVLLDASMPGLSGFEVCRYIKEQDHGADVAVVFVSGASSPTLDYVKRCAKISGGDHFISKPYDGRKVVELVRRVDEGMAVVG
jgi:DNA-binding response OmpR family regulator